MKPQDKCIELTIDLMNEYRLVDNKHPSDLNDFVFHIHALQNLLYAHKYKVEVKDSGMLGGIK